MAGNTDKWAMTDIKTITVTVTAVNDAPTLNTLADDD